MKNSLTNEIIGNTQALDFVERLAKIGRDDYLSGSYILAGHDNTVSLRLAQWFFKSLACLDKNSWPCDICPNCHQLNSNIFPDLYHISLENDKQNISIEQIKDMIGKLGLSSFSNNYRFVLIENAETLSISAANSLLKTLEEPGARIIIMLLVTDLSSLPSTICSRSQIINLKHVPADLLYDYLSKEGGLKRSLAKSIARLALGKFGLAQLYLNNEEAYNHRLEMAENFINILNADDHKRLKYCQNFSTKKDTKNNANFYPEIIFIWQTVLRDLLLINLNQPELIQNDSLRNSLDSIRHQFNTKRLVNAIKLLDQAKLYLSANVNSQMTIENAILNI